MQILIEAQNGELANLAHVVRFVIAKTGSARFELRATLTARDEYAMLCAANYDDAEAAYAKAHRMLDRIKDLLDAPEAVGVWVIRHGDYANV